MKLPIKFRASHFEYHDEIFFGFYEEDCHGNCFIIDQNEIAHIVDPNSVKQLCGYDADGNEVYEDDTVYIDKDGYYREYVAHLKGYATNPKDGCYITLDGRFDARLKEESA